MVMAVDRVDSRMIAAWLRDDRTAPRWLIEDVAVEVERLADLADKAVECQETVESLEAEAKENSERITELETQLAERDEAISDRDTRIDNLKETIADMTAGVRQDDGYWTGELAKQHETITLQAEMIELLQARVARLTAWLPADKRRKLGYV